VESQVLGMDSQVMVERQPALFPLFQPFVVRARLDKELHFHLLEFHGAEYEVLGGDFVAECFPNLGNPERHFLACGIHDKLVIHVYALRCLRTQENGGCGVFRRSQVSLEHQVEHAGFG